jgi:hypothetical protein
MDACIATGSSVGLRFSVVGMLRCPIGVAMIETEMFHHPKNLERLEKGRKNTCVLDSEHYSINKKPNATEVHTLGVHRA